MAPDFRVPPRFSAHQTHHAGDALPARLQQRSRSVTTCGPRAWWSGRTCAARWPWRADCGRRSSGPDPRWRPRRSGPPSSRPHCQRPGSRPATAARGWCRSRSRQVEVLHEQLVAGVVHRGGLFGPIQDVVVVSTLKLVQNVLLARHVQAIPTIHALHEHGSCSVTDPLLVLLDGLYLDPGLHRPILRRRHPRLRGSWHRRSPRWVRPPWAVE